LIVWFLACAAEALLASSIANIAAMPVLAGAMTFHEALVD
jgi:dipeptide/tripeptide permease